ncbi:MAG: peptidyl-prolyl cis-trans isomerase [Thermodesulfovibrionales bacterium]|nr:peptidyl-prolyl cis-trans isomerase [Thermodesulfovibrionales bacterium]
MIRFFIMGLIIVLLLAHTISAEERLPEAVVAEINGNPVYLSNFLNLLSQKVGSSSVDSVREILENIIIEELAFQRAKKLGMTVDEKNVKNAIMELKIGLGERGFSDYLKKEGLSEESLYSLIERKLLLEMLYVEEVIKKVVITEDDIKADYEKEKGKFKLPEKVIVVDLRFLKDTDDMEKKAELLLTKIKNEYNGDPWRLVQDGTFIINQIRLNREKHKELYEEAKKLKPGELSGLIKSTDGLHIIKLVDYSGERYPSLEEMRVYLENRLFPNALKKRELEWKEELKKGAEIKIYEERLKVLER